MQLEVEESGPVERKLRIQIPTVEVDAAFDKVYKQLGKRARIKGFRPGKAPRSVLEKYFSEQAEHDVLEQIVRETLPKAIEDSELKVISEPKLAPEGHPRQGMPWSYDAEVEIRPTIELAKIRGLDVPAPQIPQPEQDPVEAHLEQLRQQHAAVVDEEEGVAAAIGHIAYLDFDGRIDGEPFEGGTGEALEVEIGSGGTFPGFEDNIVGLVVGQSQDFTVEVPEDDPREEVAGKTIAFHVDLRELKRRDLAELDDEFAKDVSDFETLAELRADLQARVDSGREAQKKRAQRDNLVDALIAANPFPVPPSIVEQQVMNRIRRTLQQFGGAQLPPETLRPLVEQWQEEWKPDAERDVRLAFLVGEIARAEQIEVSDEDYDAQMRRMAEQSGQPLAKVVREAKERGIQEAVRSDLLDQKVIEFLLAEANLSEG